MAILPISGPLSASAIAGVLIITPVNLSLSGMYSSSSLSNTTPLEYSGFYGYNGTARSTAYRYSQTVGKPFLECEVSRVINVIFYHDGSFALPGNGDTCYTTSTGNNYLGNGNYSINQTSITNVPSSIITVTGGSGVISAAILCVQ